MNRDDIHFHLLAGVVGISIVAVLVMGIGTVGDDVHSSESPVGETENRQVVEEHEVSEEVKKAQPIAEEFHATITEYYPNSRVFIDKNGYIVLQYETEKENVGELKTEIHQIAEKYTGAVETVEGNATGFSVVTGKVQAVVPPGSVDAYIAGDINQNAFHQTIEVTGIERSD